MSPQDVGPAPAGGVRVEDDGPVRVVTIVNPAARNALDDPTRRGLLAALRAAADSDARVVVLSGEGATFCAGGELRSMPTDENAIRARMGEMHDVVRVLLAGRQPVIAAVEGFAYGSGLSLMAACDQVVAAADARLAATFGRVGLMGDCGLLWTLPRRVGLGRARQLLLSAEPVTTALAAAWGLVDAVVEPGSARAEAVRLGTALAERAPMALAATKRLLADADGFDTFLAAEMEAQIRLFASADFSEGRAAYFEHRQAHFSGR